MRALAEKSMDELQIFSSPAPRRLFKKSPGEGTEPTESAIPMKTL
jgi:hypothetical protein